VEADTPSMPSLTGCFWRGASVSKTRMKGGGVGKGKQIGREACEIREENPGNSIGKGEVRMTPRFGGEDSIGHPHSEGPIEAAQRKANEREPGRLLRKKRKKRSCLREDCRGRSNQQFGKREKR